MAGLNEALLVKAAGARLLRTTRVRADTTVIAANVVYPTDVGLLARAVGKLVRAARRVQAAAAQAAAVLRNGRRALPRALTGRMRRRLRQALAELAVTESNLVPRRCRSWPDGQAGGVLGSVLHLPVTVMLTANTSMQLNSIPFAPQRRA